MSKLDWKKEGLRFKCTECGKCCSGGPGVVWVSPEEIGQMADQLEMPLDDFGDKYLRLVEGRLALKEKVNFDCIFLKDKKCLVYKSRPTQCKTFPWWPANLRSAEAWERTAQSVKEFLQMPTSSHPRRSKSSWRSKRNMIHNAHDRHSSPIQSRAMAPRTPRR